MPLTRKSKWQKHPRPTKEKEMHEKRRQSWASLFDQIPKHEKRKSNPWMDKQEREWYKAFDKRKRESPKKIMTIRDTVKARDHNRCQACGMIATSLHHIIFRSQGGKNEVENLVCLCTEHHTGEDSPHQSEKWRRYWERWSKQRYPEYWEMRERV